MSTRDAQEVWMVTGLRQWDPVVSARNVLQVATVMPSVESFGRCTFESQRRATQDSAEKRAQ